MKKSKIEEILKQVECGKLSAQDAVTKLKLEPIDDIGFAKVDHHRELRQGTPEVIYGEGKRPEHILAIAESLINIGQPIVLITRMSREAAELVSSKHPLVYDAVSKTGYIGSLPEPDGKGEIVVATGGTTDIPVAEEAAITASVLGNSVVRLYDVGVSEIGRAHV